jgi:hypothetical protein
MPLFNEATYTHWIVRSIEEYFEDVGYEVYCLYNTQIVENRVPYDVEIDIETFKRFGLQFKRPNPRDPPERTPTSLSEYYWELERTQHRILRRPENRWIFYCLPDFADRNLRRVSRDHCIFVEPSQIPLFNTNSHRFRVRRIRPPYRRWGAFAQGVIECRIGIPLVANPKIFSFKATLDIGNELGVVTYFFSKEQKLVFFNVPPLGLYSYNSLMR